MFTIEKRIMLTLFLGIIFCIYGCGKSLDDSAAELGLAFDSPADSDRLTPSFKADISPILTQRCALTGCHVAEGPEGVDLRTYATLQKGGEHGPIVIAGDARESELVEEIVKGKMPPEGSPLEAIEIQSIIDWINNGAKDN
ncbi:MAG: hypothetical protein OYL97_06515 [Candidatus Poribacteria bacterium]|nr:hypothetical protein [Candidatus Poribacteria bacterium]